MIGFKGKKMSISHLLEERKILNKIVPSLSVPEKMNQPVPSNNQHVPMSYKRYICGMKRAYPGGGVPLPKTEINNKMRDSVILHRKMIRDTICDLKNFQSVPITRLSDELLLIQSKLERFIDADDESLLLDSSDDDDDDGLEDVLNTEEEEEEEELFDEKHVSKENNYEDDDDITLINEDVFPGNNSHSKVPIKKPYMYQHTGKKKKIFAVEELISLERACSS